MAEESGQEGENDYLWIIDPLDGTTNFLHGFPHFSVSIELQNKGVLEQAVIYDPLKQELFTASKGKGAQLNNRKIRVSIKNTLDGALLGTGFPYNNESVMQQFIESYKNLFPNVAGIRRAGVASLDLAYVACGRLDGFWEFNLRPWDIAAGALIIQEAGGINAELTGGADYMETGNIISANPKMIKAMLKVLSK